MLGKMLGKIRPAEAEGSGGDRAGQQAEESGLHRGRLHKRLRESSQKVASCPLARVALSPCLSIFPGKQGHRADVCLSFLYFSRAVCILG